MCKNRVRRFFVNGRGKINEYENEINEVLQVAVAGKNCNFFKKKLQWQWQKDTKMKRQRQWQKSQLKNICKNRVRRFNQ
jgi:hypothetical protein